MEKVDRAGGIFVLFKIIPYITYIAIVLLIAMIAIWIIFGIKKFRWAKTLAITLTILVVITSLLLFSPYLIGAKSGKRIPLEFYFGYKGPADEKEKFRDYRDREKDKQEDNQEYEKEKKESGLDIDIYGPSVDFVNEVVVI